MKFNIFHCLYILQINLRLSWLYQPDDLLFLLVNIISNPILILIQYIVTIIFYKNELSSKSASNKYNYIIFIVTFFL